MYFLYVDCCLFNLGCVHNLILKLTFKELKKESTYFTACALQVLTHAIN